MKPFFILFVLLFSSSVFAEDISDFQIEGMSVGDSLLEYLSRDEIVKQVEESRDFYYYLTYDFAEAIIRNNLKIYTDITVFVKPNDKEYIIYSIRGALKIENLNECLEKQKNASEEIFKIFPYSIKAEDSFPHITDKSGKSMLYETSFRTDSFLVTVVCTDIVEEILEKNNAYNHLAVAIDEKQVEDWLKNY